MTDLFHWMKLSAMFRVRWSMRSAFSGISGSRTRELCVDIVLGALKEIEKAGIQESRATISSDGEKCHAVVKGKGKKILWKKRGDSFQNCVNLLMRAFGSNPKQAIPPKSEARCRIKGITYRLIVKANVKDKGKGGRIELLLRKLP